MELTRRHSPCARAHGMPEPWPASPSPSRWRPRGFTMIELMVVVSIIAILAALVGPSMRDFAIGQRIKTASFDLYADLTYARSEAVKRNAEVIIASTGGGSAWANGWRVSTVIGGGATTLKTHAALDNSITVAGSLSAVRFERNGRPAAETEVVTFEVDDTGKKGAIEARCLSLDPSGRPKSIQGACS